MTIDNPDSFGLDTIFPSILHACSGNPTVGDTHHDQHERYHIYSRRAERLGTMATILLEHYQCEGPIFLLDAVVELAQGYLNLTVIYDVAKISSAVTQVADTQFALFELDNNVHALGRSIALYQRLLIGDLVFTCSQVAYIEARLGLALLCRFKALGSPHDCQLSWDITRRAQQGRHDEHSQAWCTVVTGLVQSSPSVWQHCAPIASEALINTLQRLRDIQRMHMPCSLRILSLATEIQLVNSIVTITGQRELLHSVLETTRSALQLCSGTAEVLRYKVMMGLHVSHFHFYHWNVKEKVNTVAHMDDTTLEVAGDARSLRALMSIARNEYLPWYKLHQHVVPSMNFSVHSKDLDAMEQFVDSLKEAVLAYSDVGRAGATHAYVFNTLAVAMGNYFHQCGSIAILDELLELLQGIPLADVLRVPFFASNIAELMLCRAEVADSQYSKSLIKEAIRICHSRKAIPDFNKVYSKETVDVELQLIAAARMQIHAGDRPCVELGSVLQMARQALTRVSPHETSARTSLILAQTDALIFRAHARGDRSLLSTGISLIETELAISEMASSIYAVDLLAAKGDLIYAQAEGLDGVDARNTLNHAWDQYAHAISAPSGRPRERFRTCIHWATRARRCGNIAVACRAYRQAIETLPRVVFLGESVIGRIEALRQVNGLASSSVSTALTLGDVPLAVEFLEQTRGILWLQSLRIRNSELEMLPMTLRTRFMEISQELEHADHLHWTTRRHKADELAHIISEIRTTPGLARFQLPPAIHEVQSALRSKKAYAVVAIPSTSHCDVVILGLDMNDCNPVHIRLATLTDGRIQEMAKHFGDSCSVARSAQRNAETTRKVDKVPAPTQITSEHESITSILAELWRSLVSLVIKYMGIPNSLDPDKRKRLWWCPIGALSSLPLHAAGIYGEPSQDHVGKYVLSSYIPTVSALHRLLSDASTTTHESLPLAPKMLLVAESHSLGLPPLHNVQVEVAQIKTIVPSRYLTDLDECASISVDDTLRSLRDAHVFHLACHGHHDPQNPLNSGFDLRNGRLTMGQLMRHKTPQAQLAYLSACDSAGMDESRPDEGLNLVGAMIFVGFRSVVGTMWAMDDIDGPFMAKRVYGRIFKGGMLDLGAVPYALDDAVRQLRESGAPASRWATYVHFGI